MRFTPAIFLGFALLLGVVLFQVKYRVSALEVEYATLQRSIHDGQESVKILQAEWSYLSEPQRLQKLSEKFLSLKPMQSRQVADLSEVMRVVDEENVVQAVLKGNVVVTEEPNGS
jgi:cell division protein FtsL